LFDNKTYPLAVYVFVTKGDFFCIRCGKNFHRFCLKLKKVVFFADVKKVHGLNGKVVNIFSTYLTENC